MEHRGWISLLRPSSPSPRNFGGSNNSTGRHRYLSPSILFVFTIILIFPLWNARLSLNISRNPSVVTYSLEAPPEKTEKHQNEKLLPSSVWTSSRKNLGFQDNMTIKELLSPNETEKALHLCGKLFYSSLHKAVTVEGLSNEVFVTTGDIGDMWVRDSVVQMSVYLKEAGKKPWLRFLVEGAIRRNAFNILQDPYANAYNREWKDPTKLALKDRVIGRGGFVAARNYELDSGAYFMAHLYDYYLTEGIYRPELLLQDPMIFQAVMLLVDTWIVEQRHDEISTYRYFELANEGKGRPTAYTGMSWTGFRPSDDPSLYGYLIPANIHAAAALERVLILNGRIWNHDGLRTKASKLLKEIEDGINQYGIVNGENGEQVYAYEVDGMGNILSGFDDANVPSLLSIPLLGWSGYDEEVYQNTRKYLLSARNKVYFQGSVFQGLGSPHTFPNFVWPMAFAIQGLTETGPNRFEHMAFQMRQLLQSACNDVMHESVNIENPCDFTRFWFEWANALFIIFVETTLGVDCATLAESRHRIEAAQQAVGQMNQNNLEFHSRPYANDYTNSFHYQGAVASVQYHN